MNSIRTLLFLGAVLVAGCSSQYSYQKTPLGNPGGANLRVLVQLARQDVSVQAAEKAVLSSGYQLQWSNVKYVQNGRITGLVVPIQSDRYNLNLVFEDGSLRMANLVFVHTNRPDLLGAAVSDLKTGLVYEASFDPSQNNRVISTRYGNVAGKSNLVQLTSVADQQFQALVSPGLLSTCTVPISLQSALTSAQASVRAAVAGVVIASANVGAACTFGGPLWCGVAIVALYASYETLNSAVAAVDSAQAAIDEWKAAHCR